MSANEDLSPLIKLSSLKLHSAPLFQNILFLPKEVNTQESLQTNVHTENSLTYMKK